MDDQHIIDRLRAIAGNYRWAWHPPTRNLFKAADDAGFEYARRNPWAWLRRVGTVEAARRFKARNLVADLDDAYRDLAEYLAAPAIEGPRVAYFCFEYGLHESFPIYSGGLGILAGDHLKAASDMRLDLVALGFLYPEGYVAQGVDAAGHQVSGPAHLDREDHPLKKLDLNVVVGMPGGAVHADVYQLDVGRSRLFLLDADNERNTDPHLRALCRRLYVGDRTVRIRQELLLGAGGMRLLRRLGLHQRVYHLNEGHCAFALAEAVRQRCIDGLDREAARAEVAARSVFTTHTPVAAGHDRFDEWTSGEHLNAAFDGDHEFVNWIQEQSQEPGTSHGSVCMTMLGLNLAGKSNGVSQIHERVSREMWGREIGHVTNGVHVPSWVAPAIVNRKPDEDLWEIRGMLRRRLLAFVRTRLLSMAPHQRTGTPEKLGDGALTIGFARRFAPYKRATLLLSQQERLAKLLTDPDRPVQILYAGKSHPADRTGMELMRLIVEATRNPVFEGRIHFVPDYDMQVGRLMVQGCDVWLNTPRRPLEASGTSGQKAAMNGCLNLSVPDGWWPEGFDGDNGWLIGPEVPSTGDAPGQDEADVESLFSLLEDQVVPTFYERDGRGVSPRWVEMMEHSIQTIRGGFSAERMLRDYVQGYYRR